MKNLLVLSFFPAFVPPKSGGEVRLFNFYFELSRFFNITLLSSGHLNSDIETIWHTNNFVEKRVPKDSIFEEQWQKLTPHAGEGDLSGPCIAACGKYLTELHKAYFESYAATDIIIHEFAFTVDYDLFRGMDDKPRIYNSNNCEYELYKKLHASSPSNAIAELVRDAEIRLLKSVDLVTYCGTEDLPAFQQMLPNGLPKTVFIPNGMTKVAIVKANKNEKPKRAVFIGSAHFPNIEAAEYIANLLAPACPEIMFDIIGNCLPLGNYPENVVRHGVVEAKVKSELILAADIAINPMLTGSGSSLKILDFVAHGIPVLSTPIGMRGFDFSNGTDCLLVEAEDFPSLLKSNINRTSFLDEMGKSARLFAYENYSWSAIAYKFKDIVSELLERHKNEHVPKPYVLALNDYDPFDSVGGGATRLQGLYSALAEWSDVIVICFSKGVSIEVAEVSTRIRCVRVPKTDKHIEEEAFFNSQFHISANDIVAFRQAGRNPILNEIYDVLRNRARIVVCEHPYMVPLPNRFGDRFVYSSQNYEYGLKKSLLEWHPNRQMLLDDVRQAEHLCVATSATVVAVSTEDAENFSRSSQAVAPIIVVRNGAGIPVQPTSDDLNAVSNLINPRSVVFLGSAHMPNVDAATFIVETLALDCPDIEFHLIGSVCQALPNSLPPNVKTWGELCDSMKSAVLQLCQIAVNPMFSGSGSNIKLADFFANGLHVVSTSFGVRGYPDPVKPHVTIADRESFALVLQTVLDDPHIVDEARRMDRRKIFAEHLSMRSLATDLVELLKDLERPKKRMLFVTYRYTSPILGGAELMLSKLISGIGSSGEFSVDLIAPEVCSISENARFSGRYYSDADISAPVGLRNVRFVRFPVKDLDDQFINEKLILAWHAQSEFEKQLYALIKSSITTSGLAWGWGFPEGTKESKCRWGFTECGLHLLVRSTVRITGFVPQISVLRVCDASGTELLYQELDSWFEVYFEADEGTVEFYVSAKRDYSIPDPRPLGMYVKHIYLNGSEIDLWETTVSKSASKNALDIYIQMEEAARLSRGRHSVSLTEMRGPHSPDLELFLAENVKHYDIVVTHNSVFRPAIAAISAAKANNIPSILIPHAHLDDDFYHFPDVHQCALDADLVLAAPKAACRFYEYIGVRRVEYLPSGIDISEKYSEEDETAFRNLYDRKDPFFLILGRKAPAKGYHLVINKIEKLATKKNVHLVLIGPDDDGVAISSNHATYLGQQPRNIVRGALRSCLALVNMSSSESFGMVLLEAWFAGRPVIANSNCSAFLDLAIHEHNSLLVTEDTLGFALDRLLSDNNLCDRLAMAGRKEVQQFSWDKLNVEFLATCIRLIKNK